MYFLQITSSTRNLYFIIKLRRQQFEISNAIVNLYLKIYSPKNSPSTTGVTQINGCSGTSNF